MSVQHAQEQITETVVSWKGVTAHPHRFGGTEYRLGNREIGHIHGDHLIDIPFPTRVRDTIVAAGKAEPHHILPSSGWISLYLKAPNDVAQALELLAQSYQLAGEQQARKAAMPKKSDVSASQQHVRE